VATWRAFEVTWSALKAAFLSDDVRSKLLARFVEGNPCAPRTLPEMSETVRSFQLLALLHLLAEELEFEVNAAAMLRSLERAKESLLQRFA
jgi:hypothetical protein